MTVFNNAKVRFTPKKQESTYDQRLAKTTTVKGFNDKEDDSSWKAFTLGGHINMAFEYDQKTLKKYTQQESFAAGFVWEYRKRFENLSQFIVKFNVNTGILLEQQYSSSANEELPEWLGIFGDAIHYETYLKFLRTGGKTVGSLFVEPDFKGKVIADDIGLWGNGGQVFPFVNGFLVPATTIILPVIESPPVKGYGLDFEVGLDIRWLSKYGIGVEGLAADQFSWFFAGNDPKQIQNIYYASAGAAFAFGGYMPLLSITNLGKNNKSNNLSIQNSAQSSDSDSLLTSSALPSISSESANNVATNPFVYNPNFASSKSAAPAHS